MINTIIIIVFLLAYLAIILEHSIEINKAAFAVFAGVVLWLLLSVNITDPHELGHHLEGHFSEIAGILFFLLGAMTTVEVIDGHKGFDVITSKLSKVSVSKLFWIVGILAFFLSAILDNLTTTILMVSLVRKMVDDSKLRWYIAGMIVISANAGGAFSPIGDVTTTMLWIGGQITAGKLISVLLIPSIICYIVPAIFMFLFLKKAKLLNSAGLKQVETEKTYSKESVYILVLGILGLISVPIVKSIFHVPPYMGMMLSLSVIWIAIEIISRRSADAANFTVSSALRNIDTPSILFFLGILLAVGALQTAGILTNLSGFLSEHITSQSLLLFVTGIASAIVDNVPLVAAFQGMYDLNAIPVDSDFWHQLCYATGTGGSLLIIGSAAGVVAMGIENISFGWYFKRIALLAFIGFAAGYISLSFML
ncbi:MAG: sodium:proton antiporter NhaD [Bacteroidia bacterium]